MNRNNIKSILRENLLLNEKEPNKKLIDDILDKVSEKGMDNISSTEKKYLDQASSGDVEEELEDQLQQLKTKENKFKEKIKKGQSISLSTLKDLPQDMVDEYLMNKMENVFDESIKKRFIDLDELELGSQKITDKYVVGQANRGKDLPKGFYKKATQAAVDKAVATLLEASNNNFHKLVDVIDLASEHIRDLFAKKAADNGVYVEPEFINSKISDEVKDYYVKKMTKLKGGDVVNKMYHSKL